MLGLPETKGETANFVQSPQSDEGIDDPGNYCGLAKDGSYQVKSVLP